MCRVQGLGGYGLGTVLLGKRLELAAVAGILLGERLEWRPRARACKPRAAPSIRARPAPLSAAPPAQRYHRKSQLARARLPFTAVPSRKPSHTPRRRKSCALRNAGRTRRPYGGRPAAARAGAAQQPGAAGAVRRYLWGQLVPAATGGIQIAPAPPAARAGRRRRRGAALRGAAGGRAGRAPARRGPRAPRPADLSSRVARRPRVDAPRSAERRRRRRRLGAPAPRARRGAICKIPRRRPRAAPRGAGPRARARAPLRARESPRARGRSQRAAPKAGHSLPPCPLHRALLSAALHIPTYAPAREARRRGAPRRAGARAPAPQLAPAPTHTDRLRGAPRRAFRCAALTKGSRLRCPWRLRASPPAARLLPLPALPGLWPRAPRQPRAAAPPAGPLHSRARRAAKKNWLAARARPRARAAARACVGAARPPGAGRPRALAAVARARPIRMLLAHPPGHPLPPRRAPRPDRGPRRGRRAPLLTLMICLPHCTQHCRSPTCMPAPLCPAAARRAWPPSMIRQAPPCCSAHDSWHGAPKPGAAAAAVPAGAHLSWAAPPAAQLLSPQTL